MPLEPPIASRFPRECRAARNALVLSAGLACLLGSLAPARAHGVLALRPGQPDRLQALAAADFNADGRLDLLAANYEGGDLSLYQESASGLCSGGSGSGTSCDSDTSCPGGTCSFAYVERNPSPFQVLEGPVFIATADLNNDGRPDAVIVDRLARAVSIRLSDSDPNLVFRATPNLILGRNPQAVAIADFNGDKNPDLAITSETDDAIYLFTGKGDGNFSFLRAVDGRTSAQKSSSTAVSLYGIASADFNDDKKMDLAVTQRKTDLLAIILGNGNGTFQAPTTLSVGRHPTYLQVAHLNSDNFPDLAILLEGGKENPKDDAEIPKPGGAALLWGNVDGTFTVKPPITEDLSESPIQIAVGRIDLDPFDDLALVNFRSSTPGRENGTVVLYPSDGSGGFGVPVTLGGPSSTLRNPRGIALMDRDRPSNGLVDRIAVGNFGGYSITFFDASGAAPFGATPFKENSSSPLTATNHPEALATGNLDQRIGEDLAIVSSGDPTLQTFSALNNGFFFKRRATPLPAGSDPGPLVLRDFNRDLLTDALVALGDLDGTAGTGTSPGFAILKGSGNNTFGSVSGLCSGGSSAETSCYSDASCPGGACSYSLAYGVCAGGTNSQKSCKTDSHCPGSTCTLPAAPTPLDAAATKLFASDLNPLDNDLDGILDAADNCPARYNPDQANTRGLVCSGGTTPGVACTTDPDCPGGGTCTVPDTRGDECDGTRIPEDDPDVDNIVDHDDNCPDVYNPNQFDVDSNRVGDACDHAPDLVALEGGSNQAQIFFGLQDTGFLAPKTVPLGTDPADIVTGNFTTGDTLSDLAVTNRGDGTFQIFKASGNGQFDPDALVPVAAGSSPGALVVLDANAKDLDLDGVTNTGDNCPTRANPGQADADRDGLGDACSQVEDPDGDGVPTRVEVRVDNCPDTYNHDQKDLDGDKIGDACDIPGDDNDRDGAPDATDNCPTRYNPDQRDSSGNGVGDACDEEVDQDADGFFTALRIRDNCPDTSNPDQKDFAADGIGDACENVQDLALVDEAGGSVNLFIHLPPLPLLLPTDPPNPERWIPMPPVPVGSQPRGLTAVDLNGDGVTDLVASSAGDSTVSILLGQGDGTFAYNTCAGGTAEGGTCNSDADCPGSLCRPDPSFSTVSLPGPVTSLRAGLYRADPIRNLPDVVGLSQALDNPVILVNVLSERADMDGSNRIDGMDLAIWAKSFGLVRGNWGYGLTADVNLDGKIDGVDLNYIAFQFGKTIPLP